MAAGIGLTPEQRRLLLQALIQGGSQGMTDPAAALQGLLAAPGGASAAQTIVAGLRNRLLPAGPSSVGSPAGPAVRASRGLSGAEPTYAQDENPSGILGETKASEKKPEEKKPEDLAAKVKELADKTPEAPAPAGNGILTVPPVPDVPDAGAAVRSAVGGSLRAAARRGRASEPALSPLPRRSQRPRCAMASIRLGLSRRQGSSPILIQTPRTRAQALAGYFSSSTRRQNNTAYQTSMTLRNRPTRRRACGRTTRLP
jgi:hypothetical protein